VDQPEAAEPLFRRYRTAEGLTTDSTRCVTEDRAGRIYVGTSRGIDRIDPERAGARLLARRRPAEQPGLRLSCRADGASGSGRCTAWRASIPAARRAAARPTSCITAVRIGGRERADPRPRAARVGELRIAPDQNSLQIDYTGVAIGAGHDLRFQYPARFRSGAQPTMAGARLRPPARRSFRASAAGATASRSAP
jgi:hypothetical protein